MIRTSSSRAIFPYACDGPLTLSPADYRGPTRVVGRIPDLVGDADLAVFVDNLSSRRTREIAHAHVSRAGVRGECEGVAALDSAVGRRSPRRQLRSAYVTTRRADVDRRGDGAGDPLRQLPRRRVRPELVRPAESQQLEPAGGHRGERTSWPGAARRGRRLRMLLRDVALAAIRGARSGERR